MKQLVIMRHAKAEASAPSDFERRLTERGHADAVEAGSWLAERVAAPDDALVSGAARTSETWEDVANGAGWDLDLVQYVDALYAAGTDAALDLIRDTSETTQTLVVIGHKPTVGMLAQLLDARCAAVCPRLQDDDLARVPADVPGLELEDPDVLVGEAVDLRHQQEHVDDELEVEDRAVEVAAVPDEVLGLALVRQELAEAGAGGEQPRADVQQCEGVARRVPEAARVDGPQPRQRGDELRGGQHDAGQDEGQAG